jgi:16S rRNA (uracil1498-N3)-methyltransferase
MRRFYLSAEQIKRDKAVITGSEAHHLRDVLRLQADERIVVIDGHGGEYLAQVVSIQRGDIKVEVLEKLISNDEPALRIAVAQGYLKDKKMDGVVRQLTELGVDCWIPFFSGRSIPLPNPARLINRSRRWQKISLESLKQCRRRHAMAIEPAVSFKQAVKQAQDYDLKIIFWEEAELASLSPQDKAPVPARVFVMIGPEGGFEADEISYAQETGFKTAGLGPRTLKAETAAVTAAVVVQTLFGDMRQLRIKFS